MQLNAKMLKCIELMVYTDMRKQDIAKELGVANNCISRWQNREDFQDALKEEMRKGFNSLALKARRKLDRLIDSNNEGVALGACKEVLSKAGYDAPQKVEQTIDSVTTIKVDIVDEVDDVDD